MGAKKLTAEERFGRRRKALVAGRDAALKLLGIDVENIPATDRDAQERLDASRKRVKAIAELIDRPASDDGSSTAPTAGRRRHAPSELREIEISPALPKAHRVEWAIDEIRDKLSARQYAAARRLHDRYLEMQPKSAVADTTGAGGASDPSKRLPLTPTQERAAREFHWVMNRLRHEREFLQATENFVLEIKPEGAERCLSFDEWGTKKFRFGRGRNNYGAGVAAVVMTCSRLVHLWIAYDADQREQCARTDRLMRSEVGQRAARAGWICSLWDWCRATKRLPQVQKEMDEIRAQHDRVAREMRQGSPLDLERYFRRRARLCEIAFRDDADGRVRS